VRWKVGDNRESQHCAMKGPQMMVINSTTSTPVITTARKLNKSSNSVETTERCSTDGTDPCMEVAPAARSSSTNPTEPSPHSSAAPLPRPVQGISGKAKTFVSGLSPHPVSNDTTNTSPENSSTNLLKQSGDGAAAAVSSVSERASSPARTMNSTASAGSGQKETLTSQSEARPPPLMQESTHSLSGKSVKSAGRKIMIPRHPESTTKRTASLPPVNRNSLAPGRKTDPLEQEQALFEQRICEDAMGVAIRKINQYGKSNLRYVRCITMVDTNTVSNRSVGSWVVRRTTASAEILTPKKTAASYKALSWGKKKDVQIALRLFTAVRKGKTTDRARRNQAPSNRILSLITIDPYHPSLDIEAPTVLDRDKFARAFARFLNVPLQEEDNADTIHSADPLIVMQAVKSDESASLPGDTFKQPAMSTIAGAKPPPASEGSFYSPPFLPSPLLAGTASDPAHGSSQHSSTHRESITGKSNTSSSVKELMIKEAAIVSLVPARTDKDDEERSHVSSLTGHGYDQELVEELHNALNELRTELDESRAEAARAVKVAEQAIQSAEKSSSVEWQNTVTHKAAEAAAMAQKRSASAMAKQRLAEERLEGERRAAAFWRKQAEVAEEEAGALQTRAAAAEVQRAAMEEQLEFERRIVSEQIVALRTRFTSTDMSQREALEEAMERNRALEMELDATRRDLQSKQELLLESNDDDMPKNRKTKRSFGRKKKGPPSDCPDYTSLLSENSVSSSSAVPRTQSENVPVPASTEGYSTEQVLKVHAETQLMRRQFELLKRATSDHLEQLPEDARLWCEQISHSLQSSQGEVARLQEKLAMESASRRKLLHEVQDLRGAVRVYCRPRPSGHKGLLSLPSHDTILLHRDKFQDDVGPVSFEFDRVFEPHAQQQDVYTEVEEVCLGVLDGYNICLMTYGPSRCGKTCTLLGDVNLSSEKTEILSHGIHLKAMKQLFTIAHHRSDRYKDTFSLTIIEVYNDRIRDLLSATQTGESRGQMTVAETKNSGARRQKPQDDDASSGRPSKLEIRTDIHGDTVIQGLVAVEVKSFEEVTRIWEECLEAKTRRLEEQGLDQRQYDASCHVIATLRVKSSNIATGIGSLGKIQFADLAAADIVPRRSAQEVEVNSAANHNEWRFANRSLETLSECIEAKIQFDRSVPYRNSTLTHLLRDSLEADSKVLLIACVSSDPKDIEETIATLKFASRIRRVTIGKATKHTLSPS
jgi:kinesin family member C2/C3